MLCNGGRTCIPEEEFVCESNAFEDSLLWIVSSSEFMDCASIGIKRACILASRNVHSTLQGLKFMFEDAVSYYQNLVDLEKSKLSLQEQVNSLFWLSGSFNPMLH